MIIAAEMQNAMDQELRQLLIKRSSALFGLTDCSRHRNHDVTKQARGAMRRLPHRKGQHIRRAILAAVPTIETSHSLVTDEHDAKLRRRFADIAKNRLCQSIYARLVKRHTSNVTLRMDRH